MGYISLLFRQYSMLASSGHLSVLMRSLPVFISLVDDKSCFHTQQMKYQTRARTLPVQIAGSHKFGTLTHKMILLLELVSPNEGKP